jgi:serine/threonine protein kinase
MGEVTLCVDRNTRRQVALKRILPAAAENPARRSRFVEEAQVTAQLEHPNIVPVHELDRTPDGSIYFTMKLVKGKSLADILKAIKAAADHVAQPPSAVSAQAGAPSPRPYAPRGDEESDAPRPPLPSLSDLLQVFLKVCDGVAFAHSRGVIHRDLKPANIMVGEYGEVLVMDWGLAKLLGGAEQRAARPYAPRGDELSDAPRPPVSPLPSGEVARRAGEGRRSDGVGPSRPSRSSVPHPSPLPGGEGEEGPPRVRTDRREEGLSPTLDGATLGTPAYMSPEQANGELDKIDPRSDIYSLGAILYEILTLERAIEGETPMMVLANAARNRIVPIEKRASASRIPRELSAIAMKCLAKSRAARYRAVLDLRRDIALFLEGRSVSARPDTLLQGLVKLVKRNKGVSAAVAAAAVIIVALTAGFIFRVTHEVKLEPTTNP